MDLVLYMKPTCPFCVKVIKYLDSRNISVKMKNLSENPSYIDELIQIGGKKQVPCLVIDGKPLYESDDIIEWFENHM